MTKLFILLSIPVMLISCGKKALSGDESVANSINSSATTVSPVVASDPAASIGSDFLITSTGDDGRSTAFTVATQDEYNSMDYTNRIFYTAVHNAGQYLSQLSDGESVLVQLNADNTYSIEGNPTVPYTGLKQTCMVCGVKSLYKCMQDIEKYKEQNGQNSVHGEITSGTSGGSSCLRIVYWYNKVLPPSAPTITGNGGMVFETFTPPIKYATSRFNSFIRQVQTWATSDANPNGAASSPEYWTRQELDDYVKLYKNDPANADLILSKKDDFQVQLAYYVYHDMPVGFH